MSKPRIIRIAGLDFTMKEASEAFEINYKTLSDRIDAGMSPAQAVTFRPMTRSQRGRLAASRKSGPFRHPWA